MFTTYVLYSKKFNKIYIGFTSDLDNRVASHNIFATKGFTIRYRPWLVLITETFQTKAEAIRRELSNMSRTADVSELTSSRNTENHRCLK
ncbi:MAG: GIY-YIG nuclease family protein [Sphingobacteriales bacterium]|nr:MAG: GIY-YIG nuclease family protein [Sphingobacteriales bacterium]